MKTLLAFLAILLCCPIVQAQNIEHQIIASQFGAYQVPTVGNGFAFPPDSCQVSGGGKNFPAFTVSVPVKIVDSNPAHTEVQTPVAVNLNNNNCSVSMTTTYPHASFYLTSGTGGLQEALNAGQVTGGANTVILDQQWYALVAPSVPATVIANVHGSSPLGLMDVTTTPYTPYAWNGTAYVQIPTGGGANTPATTNLLKGGGPVNTVNAAIPGTDYVVPSALVPLAPLASPALSGNPTAPTQACGSNTSIATGAYVANCAAGGAVFPGTNGLVKNTSTTTSATAVPGTDYVIPSGLAPYAPLASPALTGTPTAPTQAISTNNTDIATTAAVNAVLATYAPLASPALTGVPTVPTASLGTSTTQAASTAFVIANGGSSTKSISVLSYGASCNWNGTTGTDDTAAFQSAVTAAGAIYAATGGPVTVNYPYGCTMADTTSVTVPSGVVLKGGSIFIALQSAVALFETVSTDNVSFDGGLIYYVSNNSSCGPTQNNDLCIAIRYDSANPGTTAYHSNFTVNNLTIVNSGWGILVGPQAGTDILRNIIITNNRIIESQYPITSYQYADGIHVGGGVRDGVISNNIVTGRSDAGIAVTSEMSTVLRQCSNFTITGNVLYQDRVGIDDSGCQNLEVGNNFVWADITISNSNPAFRAIWYYQLPTNLNIHDNTFVNYQNPSFTTDNSAKFDCTSATSSSCGVSGVSVNYYNASFTNNKTINLYVRGSGVWAQGNTFLAMGNGSSYFMDWDTTNVVGSYDDVLGPNIWQGPGKIDVPNRYDILYGDFMAPQTVGNGGVITYQNPQMWGSPPSTASNYTTGYYGWYGFSGDTTGPGVGAPDTYLTRLSTGTLGVGQSVGGTNGAFKTAYLIASSSVQAGTNPSGSGVLNIGNSQNVCARNAANSADDCFLAVDAGNNLDLGGGSIGAVNLYSTAVGSIAGEETVTYSATPTFALNVRASTVVLSGNITSFTLPTGKLGQEKTLTFCQNATGGYTVGHPANVHGFFPVGVTANTCSSQHFTYVQADAAWLADSPGVINQ